MKKNFSILTTLTLTFAALAFFGCTSKPKEPEKKVTEPEITEQEKQEEDEVISAQEILVDDFEEGMFFDAVGNSWNDGDVSLKCELSTDWGTEGGTSLKCTVKTNGAEWEKGGFFTTPYETDWTGMTLISLDVYNPNPFEMGICLVLQDGENWEEWNQFTGQTVAAESNVTLTFEIPSKKYLNAIQRLIVYSWGAVPETASFYIDNIVAKN